MSVFVLKILNSHSPSTLLSTSLPVRSQVSDSSDICVAVILESLVIIVVGTALRESVFTVRLCAIPSIEVDSCSLVLAVTSCSDVEDVVGTRVDFHPIVELGAGAIRQCFEGTGAIFVGFRVLAVDSS